MNRIAEKVGRASRLPGVVGTARCAVRAAFSGATVPNEAQLAARTFRPLQRGRGHRSAMSLPPSSSLQIASVLPPFRPPKNPLNNAPK